MRGAGGRGRRRRVGGANGGPPTDLLVCFPTRAAHLTLMPKPVCSPSRPPPASVDQTRTSGYRPQQSYNPSRPLFRTGKAPSRSQIGSDVSEPTSPKVTCAGQIKVRPRNGRAGAAAAAAAIPGSKGNNWLESVGIKKDVMNFLGTLRSLRFNMGCFGAFNAPIVCSSDDEDEDEEEEEEVVGGSSQCRTIFSKWFMVLEENQGKGDEHDNDHDHDDDDDIDHEDEFAKEEEEEEEEEEELPPPKNALLLMRCRSAPAKRRELEVERKEEEKEEEGDEERLMLMSYAAPDFFKVSTDIAKETWLVGSLEPMLARSRSWRR
ncbi:putative nucleolin [Iris pallida]|uniref:Nucleolin n=1 Tax=Iris pallida TaxID=29817 RepID=A0AAX6FEU8_IRIPA|nr:putative nucleolin [Iris pallida]